MPTKLARRLDQMYLSRAELGRNHQVKPLKSMVKDYELNFIISCSDEFGRMFVRRLKKSAKKAGRSLLGYTADVLLK